MYNVQKHINCINIPSSKTFTIVAWKSQFHHPYAMSWTAHNVTLSFSLRTKTYTEQAHM
jgi:hypothetical protein